MGGHAVDNWTIREISVPIMSSVSYNKATDNLGLYSFVMINNFLFTETI